MKRHPAAAAASLLVVVFLAVQTLGFLHRIAHGGQRVAVGAVGAVVGSVAMPVAAAATAPPAAHGWLQSLFAGHAGARDCDAFDQTSHADAVTVLAPEFGPSTHAAAFVAVHRAWHIAAQAQGFLARAPPFSA